MLRVKSILKYSVIIVAAISVGSLSTALFLVSQQTPTSEELHQHQEIQEMLKPQQSHVEAIMAECESVVHCATHSLSELAKGKDRSTVLATFTDLITKYDQSVYRCHETAHHLGMFLYSYIGSLNEALPYAKQECGGAVFHGIIQGFFSEQVAKHVSPEDVDIAKVCPETDDNPYSIDRWQCLHGIGHGLTVLYDYDVFNAVKRCEVFDPGWEQISCSKGLFMQNAVNYLETGYGKFDKNDILFPCNQVESKYAPACYHYHTSYILKQKGGAIFKSFKECDKIIPEELVEYCYHGMGRQLSGHFNGVMDLALVMCKGGQPVYHTDCLRGLVMTHVNRNTSPDQGFQFCKLLPEEFKVDCYDAMGRWTRMLHSTDEARADECSKAENPDYVQVCMNADLKNLTLL